MNNTPTKLTPEQESLRDLAREVEDFQRRQTLGVSALCKKFAGIGSDRTYNKILAGQFDGLDIDRQTHNYTQVLELIKIELESGDVEEPDYEDMPNFKDARLAVTDVLRETGNDRLVIIQGQTGSGKSTIARLLRLRWPLTVMPVEADETWKESPGRMLTDLLSSLGNLHCPATVHARELKAIELLKIRKLLIFVDEAHHLGPRSLNIVKTLINKTPSAFVFFAIPTLFRRLETTAYEEARQLTRNRLLERVVLDGPDKTTAMKFLERRGIKFIDEKTARQCAGLLVDTAKSYGLWKFVNLVARRARRDSQGEPLQLEQFIAAQQAVIKTR